LTFAHRSKLLILLGAIFAAAFSAAGIESDDDPRMDFLPNPFAADRPEWDPFGPRDESYYAITGVGWDPLSPGGLIPQLLSASPFGPDQGLLIGDEVRTRNQLYLQSGGLLVTRGEVNLAAPYTLWLYVSDWAPLALYDRGSRILNPGSLPPGWYRLDLWAETLEAHRYHFDARTRSNNVTISVSSAGYPIYYGLVGRVVDARGNGVPNARVRISGSGGGIFSTVTNGQGYYGMDLPSGTYSVTAELEGFSFTTSTARVWTGAVSAAGILVGYPASTVVYPVGPPQEEYGWLEGRVAERSGAPIPGARVRIDGIFSVTTDADGGYRVSLIPGWHSITVDARGYKFSSTSVQIRPGHGAKLDLQGTKVIALGKYG
jgi:hypothetical protein